MNLKISNISSLQVFQLIRFVSLFLISIVFAKSYLSTSEIGNYETLLFISGAVSFFWVSGIIQSFLPIYKNNESGISEEKSIFNLFFLIATLSVLTAVLVFILRGSFSSFVSSPEQLNYIEIFVIYILLNNPTFIIEYIYLIKNKPKQIISYGLISYTLQFLFVVLPILLGFGIQEVVYGLILISALRLGLLAILLVKYSEFSLSSKFLKEHLSLASPLMFSMVLSGSAQYIDGIIISNKYDSATFAVFRYGARELPIVVLLANAFSNGMLPMFADKANINTILADIKAKSRKLMNFLFPITFILLISSNFVYPYVFNEDFTESAKVFNVYLLLILARLVFPQTILIGLKRTNLILFTSMAELIINVSLSLLFINYFGIIGVAIATLIAFASEKLILTSLVYFKLKILPKQYISVLPLILYSFITLFLYYVVDYIFWIN